MVNQESAPPLVVLSFLKRLVAMNAHTGQRAWECDTGLAHDGRLVVDQGLVIYMVHTDILCLDYLTGALRWKAKLPLSADTLPLLFAGCIVVTALGEAACLNAQTGAQLWHDKFKGYGAGSGPMAAPGVASQVDRRS